MKIIYLLLFILFVSTTYSQNGNINTYGLNNKNSQETLITLDMKVDSLEHVLERQNINQSYFSSALSSQTAIFSLIVVSLISIISYFTYKRLERKITILENNTSRILKNYNDDMKQFQESINHQRMELYRQSAGINMLISQQNTSNKYLSLRYIFQTALDTFHFNNIDLTNQTLKMANQLLDKILGEKINNKELQNNIDKYLEIITILFKSENDEMLDLLSDMHVKLKPFKK